MRYRCRLAEAGCDTGVGWPELGAIPESAGRNWVRYRGRLAEAGCDIGVGWPKLGAISGSVGRSWVRYGGRLAGLGAIPESAGRIWVRYRGGCDIGVGWPEAGCDTGVGWPERYGSRLAGTGCDGTGCAGFWGSAGRKRVEGARGAGCDADLHRSPDRYSGAGWPDLGAIRESVPIGGFRAFSPAFGGRCRPEVGAPSRPRALA